MPQQYLSIVILALLLYLAPPDFGHDLSSGARYNAAKPEKSYT